MKNTPLVIAAAFLAVSIGIFVLLPGPGWLRVGLVWAALGTVVALVVAGHIKSTNEEVKSE